MNFGGGEAKKAWKDIWGCGQGIAAVKAVVPAAELIGAAARRIRGRAQAPVPRLSRSKAPHGRRPAPDLVRDAVVQ